MTTTDGSVAQGREGRQTWLFTVRIWSDPGDGVDEPRGQVRDVHTGAFGAFRTWADLTSFLAEQVDRVDPVRLEEEGG